MRRIVSFFLMAAAGVACSDSTTGPSAIATGNWIATTTAGLSLDFTVAPDAGSITQITYRFAGLACGGTTLASGSIQVTQTPGWAIANRAFTITRTSAPAIVVVGTFGANGTSASGTWQWSTCSGSWTGSH